jgi:murein L,D-transpeptidase YafK
MLVPAALLASIAALAWPIAGRSLLARVHGPDGARAELAARRVRPALEAALAPLGLAIGDAVFLRIFKEERELELWMAGAAGAYRHVKTYPICSYSGALGPKRREGDRQAPEGFYAVRRGRLNPASSYHLSFDLGYPNAYDRAHGRTGAHLMVHGSCVSIGCYAMGDAAIEEIYTLVDAALARGQDAVPVHAFPFRLVPAQDARVAASEWAEFWSDLRAGYVAFETTRTPPRVAVRDGRYVVAP